MKAVPSTILASLAKAPVEPQKTTTQSQSPVTPDGTRSEAGEFKQAMRDQTEARHETRRDPHAAGRSDGEPTQEADQQALDTNVGEATPVTKETLAESPTVSPTRDAPPLQTSALSAIVTLTAEPGTPAGTPLTSLAPLAEPEAPGQTTTALPASDGKPLPLGTDANVAINQIPAGLEAPVNEAAAVDDKVISTAASTAAQSVPRAADAHQTSPTASLTTAARTDASHASAATSHVSLPAEAVRTQSDTNVIQNTQSVILSSESNAGSRSSTDSSAMAPQLESLRPAVRGVGLEAEIKAALKTDKLAVEPTTPPSATDAKWLQSLQAFASATTAGVGHAPLIHNAAPAATVVAANAVVFANPQWDTLMGERVLQLVSQRVQAAEIHLDPPELGPIQVRIAVNQGEASVNFISANAGVREALDQSAFRLRELFAEEGLNLVDVDVSDRSSQQQTDDNGDDAQAQAGAMPALNADINPITPAIKLVGLVDYYV